MGYRDTVLSTKMSKANSTKYSKNQQITNVDVNQRVQLIVGDLIEFRWLPYYCKAYKILGESRFMGVVSTAKTGDNPKTLLGWLMKRELNRK